MDNPLTVTLTQLTAPDIRMLLREELQKFFQNRAEVENEKDQIGGISLAVEITGLAKATIYSRASARSIPHRKQGKKLYFSRKELNEWIELGRRKTFAEVRSAQQGTR